MKKQCLAQALIGLSLVGICSFTTQAATFNGYAYGEFNHPTDTSPFSFYGLNGPDADIPEFNISDGEVFSLGNFSYLNSTTSYTSPAEPSAMDFRINVHLCNIDWISFDYSLRTEEVVEGQSTEGSQLSLISLSEDFLFEYNGQSYVLEILGYSQDKGSSFSDSLYAASGTLVTAGVYARIEAVPVPAAAWLFGSGLIALLSIVKRNRKQIS